MNEKKCFEIKQEQHKEEGIVHAVVSVFNVTDSHGDIIIKGAFRDSIERHKKRGTLPPGIFYHDCTKPVAKTVDAWEDNEGLHVIGKFNLDTQRGRETFSDIKAGILNEYSFGFRVLQQKKTKRGREILKVDWVEWSPVLIGANRCTYTASVKSKNHYDDESKLLRIYQDAYSRWLLKIKK